MGSSSSSELVPLPEDVVSEILVRLPVKSILRARCVCKSWRDLIESPAFVSMHFNYQTRTEKDILLIKRFLLDDPKNTLSLHYNDDSLSLVSPPLDLHFFESEYQVEVLGPCNGIICIHDLENIVLCNPSTREFKLLPDRPFGCPPLEGMQWLPAGVGFGFDPASNNYKVIRFVNYLYNDTCRGRFYPDYRAEVYNLSTDSWRQLDASIPLIHHTPYPEASFNGKCYRDVIRCLLSFDLSTEIFREIEYPDGVGKTKSLFVLNESLCLVCYVGFPNMRPRADYVEVWEMKEHWSKESWTKLFVVEPILIETVLSVWKLEELFFENEDGQLVSCIFGKQEIRKLDIKGFKHSLRVVCYRESLVSIK